MHTCWLTQIGCSSKTANHVAATQYIKACRHCGDVQFFYSTKL
uniref:Uncharacterized protein n=1 Tax=Anguilla anguilla TaxID=7936 RepID=A0A0E9U9W8_ANGAN